MSVCSNHAKSRCVIILLTAFVLSDGRPQDSFGTQTTQPTQSSQQSTASTSTTLKQSPKNEIPNQPVPSDPGALKKQSAKLSDTERFESQDFGISPTAQLQNGSMHGPTPTMIPGGQTITTDALFKLLTQNPGNVLIFDILGGPQILPGALNAYPASAPGDFNDRTQQEFGNYIQQVTNGNKQTPVVFYCQSPYCWMSYNAALRAINMGYKQVLWYRGGIEAWQMAGLPLMNP